MLDKQILKIIKDTIEEEELCEINEDYKLKESIFLDDEFIFSETLMALEDEFDITIDENDLIERIENDELETFEDFIEYIISIINTYHQ